MNVYSSIQTRKRLKRLFIMTKHKMLTVGVSLFSKLQQTVKMRCRIIICFGLICFAVQCLEACWQHCCCCFCLFVCLVCLVFVSFCCCYCFVFVLLSLLFVAQRPFFWHKTKLEMASSFKQQMTN